MSEIPDEIRVELAKDYVRQNFESGEPWSLTIARAILSERNRCANVAVREADDYWDKNRLAEVIRSGE